jgi:hypothetical protein
MKNRKELPGDLLTTASQLHDHEYTYRQRGELGALVWKDRRLVYLLTTHTSPASTSTVQRKSNDGTTIERSVPTAVADYNQHKSGVDTLDQLHANYSIGRKSKKWWPRLVWWLIDMCIINAYSLYQQQQQVRISQLQFRQQLMQELVEKYKRNCNNTDNQSSTSSQIHHSHHWPKHIQQQHDCIHCSIQPNQPTRTNFQCEQCRVYLCVDPCFKLYHSVY